MSGYTKQIVVQHGHIGPVTRRVNGSLVLYPGLCVTATGQTFPDVILPATTASSVVGIAGCNANQDIDTAYADNAEFPVFLCGSGAIVYGMHKGTPGGGSIVEGDILCAHGAAAAGQVVPLANAIKDALVADPTNTVLATALDKLFAIVGRAAETQASATNTVPIKVLLSV